MPGEIDVYEYPNAQLPATLWYHDHALGITRLNVYGGMAGYYLLRDDFEDALGLPAGEFEIPAVIQDREFNPDGSLVVSHFGAGHVFRRQDTRQWQGLAHARRQERQVPLPLRQRLAGPGLLAAAREPR